MSDWRRFWRVIMKTALATGLFLFGFVIVLDPYNTLPFSPPLDRLSVTTNARFSYPAIAADPSFDSLIVGTSTARLLYPPLLDEVLGGRFANLSMNSARAYEQMRVVDLFVHYHPDMKTLIIGVDSPWCNRQREPRFTDRPFPPWLFDKNPWNDVFYLFNYSALEEAGRQLGHLTGLRAAKHDRTGYANFLPPPEEYNAETVREHLYRGKDPFVAPPETPPADNHASVLAGIDFPQLVYLRQIVDLLPDQAEIVTLFVPFHQSHVPVPGSRDEAIWNACKQEITQIINTHNKAHSVDFMIRSEITMHDDNYWDHLHYTAETAVTLVNQLGKAIETGRSDPAFYQYLDTQQSVD